MLFLQFMLYSSSFVDALKNEIPEAALELCQLKIKQLSPNILKFGTKDKDNPFTFNCSVVYRSFLFVFHAGSRGLTSNNSRNSSQKKKWPVRPVFPDYLSVSYDYVGINDLLTNNSRSGMDNLFYNLKKITEKCLMFGVECFYFRAGLYH